ncbi:MAG: PPE domain-containing protein, partial [Mycobacterium sp.]
AAAQAEAVAGEANAVAAVFDAAREATVHPGLVAANRFALVSLVRSNLLGLNAPAIAAAEAQYEQMWAQDVSAMFSYYGGAATAAAQLTPWAEAMQSRPNLGIGNIGSGNVGNGNIGSFNIGGGNSGPGATSGGKQQRGLRQLRLIQLRCGQRGHGPGHRGPAGPRRVLL